MRFSILLLIIITVLSLMPGQEFPETDVSFADKWVHWFMYGTWTVVVLWEDRKRKMELAQAFLTTTRSGEWMDLWANVFGVICGWALFGGWSAARSRKA